LWTKYPIFSTETLEPDRKYPRPEAPNVRSWAEGGTLADQDLVHIRRLLVAESTKGLSEFVALSFTIIDWRSLTPESLNPEKRASSHNS
jgi:hypothetical protein